MNPYKPTNSNECAQPTPVGLERIVAARLLGALATVCCGFASSWMLVNRLNEVFRPNMPFGLLLLFLFGVLGSIAASIILVFVGRAVLLRGLFFSIASIAFAFALTVLAMSFTYQLPNSATRTPIDLLVYSAIEILLPTAIGIAVFSTVRTWQNREIRAAL
jgi:hypothetical protein